jgi:hypothetical protein
MGTKRTSGAVSTLKTLAPEENAKSREKRSIREK